MRSTGARQALDPAELEEALRDGGAEGPGEVRAAFGPVQAGSYESAPALAHSVEVDAKHSESLRAARGGCAAVGERSDQSLVLKASASETPSRPARWS